VDVSGTEISEPEPVVAPTVTVTAFKVQNPKLATAPSIANIAKDSDGY